MSEALLRGSTSAQADAAWVASAALVADGVDEVTALAADIDAIARRNHSATARWGWISIALSQAAHVWAVAALDGPRVTAAAALVTDESGVTRLAAGGDGYRAAITADNESASHTIGQAILSSLLERDCREIEIGPVPAGDPALGAIIDGWPGRVVITTCEVPVVRRGASADVADYVSHGMRRTLRKAHNRLAADGRSWQVQTVRDPEAIVTHLDEVAELAARRDHDGGRTSLLDDAAAGARWRSRIATLATFGAVELTTLFIDDSPAAHDVAIVDGPWYRVMEGRYEPAWRRYAPGRLLEAELLQRVVSGTQYGALDWMSAAAPEQLLTLNDTTPLVSAQLLLI